MDERIRGRLITAVSAGAAMVGIVAAATSFVELIGPKKNPFGAPSVQPASGLEVQTIEAELKKIRSEQAIVSNALRNSSSEVSLIELQERVKLLDQRLSSLEAFALDSPEKVLSLPLLKKEVENIRETNAQSLISMKASVDQVYDLNKWLLGGIALAIIGLAISNLLTKDGSKN